MTNLSVLINYLDADVNYATTPGNFIALDLTNDYFIWTEGDSVVKDLMTHEPTASELNQASSIIDPNVDKEVNLCLLMDYSHDVGGAYYTHKVLGMGENKRYVYGFSFDGPTASEPTLEVWDDSNHNSTSKHVLGAGTPANSMVKGVVTTTVLPGVSWAGISIAGDGVGRRLFLNDTNGALASLPSGQTSQELYANLKIVIPTNYATPAIETFITTIRFTWN